jgi:hypothetical protein
MGPHYWINEVGKKHYKLMPHHMRSLIKHMQQGSALQSHDDMPNHIHAQLYAEEQQDAEHRRKRRAHSLADYPPIHITNVLPSQAAEAATVCSTAPTSGSSAAALPRTSTRLHIPGFREDAMQEYTAWQCSQVRTQEFKMEYQKASALTLAECLSLQQVYQAQDVDFYVANGIKKGTALSYVSNIGV